MTRIFESDGMIDALSIGFVGDISLARHVREVVKTNGAEGFFASVKDAYSKQDLVIGNLECVIIDDAAGYAEVDSPLWTTPEVATCLEYSGISVLSLANNHVLDCGREGLNSTILCLKRMGIQSFGAGSNIQEAEKPLVVELNGTTIALLGACDAPHTFAAIDRPGTAPYCRERLIDRVRDAKAKYAVVVVMLHADFEFTRYPSPYRLSLSRQLAKEGAHLVIQHHPHVIQGIEVHDGALIAYSLGNHVFGFDSSSYQGVREGTRDSMLLVVDIDFKRATREISYSVVPMYIDFDHITKLCVGEVAISRIERIDEISVALHDIRLIRKEWFRLCRSLAKAQCRRMYYLMRDRNFVGALLDLTRVIKSPKLRRWVYGFLTLGYK